ncbi:hypothetical protein T11_535 [Trichinella zimbabwensis]|uniref:Uncharacterized protein n=1 Tax=Trichinella zimbabwensis TaxID=268475 RepID=A0A0V1I4Y8_9BILA|nr:hypothetical protein T11_535 [Trichinella zimbabwensis]
MNLNIFCLLNVTTLSQFVLLLTFEIKLKYLPNNAYMCIQIFQKVSLSSCVFLSRFKDHGHEHRMEILDLYRGMELARAVTQRPSLFSHWSSGLTTIEFIPA